MTNENAMLSAWWGTFEIPRGKRLGWRIGPLTMVITRLEAEWRIVRRQLDTDLHTQHASVEFLPDSETTDEGFSVSRLVTSNQQEAIQVSPIMPDLSVVTRPEYPITVLPQQELNLFVGSPAWLRLSEPDAPIPMQEIPIAPPHEAWWGPNTMTGELCYATRTFGRLRLEEILPFPHRVVTPIAIRNGTSTELQIERVNLPVRRLGIYADNQNRLWTEAVTMTRTTEGLHAELKVESVPPSVAGSVQQLAGPRETHNSHGFIRAFGSLFG